MAKKAKRAFNLTDYSKDVTINDFANSSVPKSGRVKKNEINNVISQVKKISVAENDKSWDEKLKYLDGNRTGNKDGSKSTLKNKDGSRRAFKNKDGSTRTFKNKDGSTRTFKNKDGSTRTFKNKRKGEGKIIASGSGKNCATQYRAYPIELWFKVSEFIAPEDVGRFASICRDTRAVVLTARFWYGLYERHYKKVPDLPELLQPQCIVRKYGLRANVIRALYFMYPPFVSKIGSEVPDGNPRRLVKRVCVLSWSQKQKNHWLFYFKLKRSQHPNFRRKKSDGGLKPGLLEMLEDISANVDEDCKLLEVTCTNYVPLPMISGQRLNGVSMKLTQDFQHHRLELNFGCGTSPHMGSSYVTLDSVSKVRVLDWWHPSFPHSNSLNYTSHSSGSNYLVDEIDSNII